MHGETRDIYTLLYEGGPNTWFLFNFSKFYSKSKGEN